MKTAEECPVKKVLYVFEHKWYPRVMYELVLNKTMRFGQFKKAIPEISGTMLSQTLRQLEGNALIKRKEFYEIPPHVEYSLTQKGRGIIPVFKAIEKWGNMCGK